VNNILGGLTSSIRNKISASLGVIIFLVLAVAMAGYYQLAQVQRSTQRLIPESRQTSLLQDFALSLSSLDGDLERLFVIGGPQFKENVLQDLDSMAAAVESLAEIVHGKVNPTPGELERLKELETSTASLETDVVALLEMESSDFSSREINQRIVSVYTQIDDSKGLHQRLSEETQAQLHAIALSQEHITSSVIIQFLILAILVVMIVVLTWVFTIRSIAAPLTDLADASQQIAAGNLEARAPDIASEDEVGILASNFNTMVDRVATALEGLEERSRALETSAQVSRRLSTILDRKQLVAEVVSQVQQAFDYYHAHIYLTDEASGDLVMAGGTGEAGREMLANGHRLAWGKGLVGRAATSQATVLVPDVSQEEGWLPNPLLPETRAEVAVPIMAGEWVLGVLDVQHNVVGGLGESDAELLGSIAGQVAVALQNTRLFAETQRRAERETHLNLITQRIQNASTVESALQIAVRELGQALKAQETTVRLLAAAQAGDGRRPEQ
jgi:putative methionine-R-sulfoxide reductase with GAF domain